MKKIAIVLLGLFCISLFTGCKDSGKKILKKHKTVKQGDFKEFDLAVPHGFQNTIYLIQNKDRWNEQNN